ncbi:MAG: hypothetical protein ACRD0N_14715 [Acidimicrobiales bacterium]
MGVVIGFAVGYVFGTRAGREGYAELRDAVATIADSRDVREAVGAAISVVGSIVKAGKGAIGDESPTSPLRSIA